MSDHCKGRRPNDAPAIASRKVQDRPASTAEPDFAAQMARAEFGRHYVDTGRIEQALKDGEIVFRHRAPGRRRGPR